MSALAPGEATCWAKQSSSLKVICSNSKTDIGPICLKFKVAFEKICSIWLERKIRSEELLFTPKNRLSRMILNGLHRGQNIRQEMTLTPKLDDARVMAAPSPALPPSPPPCRSHSGSYFFFFFSPECWTTFKKCRKKFLGAPNEQKTVIHDFATKKRLLADFPKHRIVNFRLD